MVRIGMVRIGTWAAAMVVVVAAALGGTSSPAAAQPTPIQPIPSQPPSGAVSVSPSWENAPWETKVQTLLNVTAQVGIACCVFAFLAGAAAMSAGRLTGSYQASNRGLPWLLGGAGGAIVIASAAPMVNWLIS